MSEHTPGPWHYYEHETYRTVEPGIEEPEDSWIEIRDEGDIMVATLPGGSIYDGALIAAAPQLLKACKVALNAINQNDETLTARDYLTAAIEATEGES